MRSRARLLLHVGLLCLVVAAVFVAARQYLATRATPGTRSVREAVFRSDIASAYPGFRIVEFSYFDTGWSGWPGESSASKEEGYLFRLESADTTGFQVVGRYYTGPLADDAYRAAFRDRSLFAARRLSRQQLIELERLWVKSHPEPVDGGESAGPVDDVLQPAKQQYFKGNTYVLYVGDNSGTRYYFRLDPKTKQWSEERDYRDHVL